MFSLPLTRQDALAAWHQFRPHCKRYADCRNAVQPGHKNVSRLSAAIRFGLLSTEELVYDTLEHSSLCSAEKWVQELCWRSYWKGWLELRPNVWQSWRQRVRELQHTLPSATLRRRDAIQKGQSGIAILDHFTQELMQTGYLHNHARMWWASYWIHAQNLPWELGADFFFRHLLDADPASNTLSWRWVAGLQTRGKTYLVRQSNMERYVHQTLLKDGQGLEQLANIQPAVVAEHADLSQQTLAAYATQLPLVKEDYGLWLHADDCTLETGPLAKAKPRAVAAFTSPQIYAKMQLSTQRCQAISTALQDGVSRAAEHFQCAGSCTEATSLAEALSTWARQQNLRQVLAIAPYVGPVADALPAVQQALQEAGIQLQLLRRSWDAELFPQARAGFFGFWDKTHRQLQKNCQMHG
jgi:deoxyribodipyrimidine photo-lyase